MARTRTVLSAVVVIVALGVATVLTLAYRDPSLPKFMGLFLLLLAVQIPVVMFAAAACRQGGIRIVDRDSA